MKLYFCSKMKFNKVYSFKDFLLRNKCTYVSGETEKKKFIT